MPCPGAGTHASADSNAEMRSLVPEAPEAGGGEHERVELAGVELAQPRVEIAADRREPCAREQRASAARSAGRCSCRSAAPSPDRSNRRLSRAAIAGPAPFAPAARARRAHPRAAARRRAPDRRAAPPACPCCCARRGRSSPASSASSISLTNRRLPPISESGASASRSPDVLMTTISQTTPALRSQQRRHALRLEQRELAAARAESSGASCDVRRVRARYDRRPRCRRPTPAQVASAARARRHRSRNRRLTASV